MGDISIFAQNLRRFDDGEITGDWLDLPVKNSEILSFYEEYIISEIESDFNIGEYEDIRLLNKLAEKLKEMSECEKNIAAAYCNSNGYRTVAEIYSVCMQLDDISYLYIDDEYDKELAVGYALVDNSELEEVLKNCKVGDNLSAYDYFDFEKYGRDALLGGDGYVAREFFIFANNDIDEKLYSAKDILEEYP
jgi:hypothetical protein